MLRYHTYNREQYVVVVKRHVYTQGQWCNLIMRKMFPSPNLPLVCQVYYGQTFHYKLTQNTHSNCLAFIYIEG